MTTLRTTTLMILGAIGYLAFLAAAAAKIMGFDVPWELLGLILLTSSGLLGVDFGFDVFPSMPSGGNRSGDRKE